MMNISMTNPLYGHSKTRYKQNDKKIKYSQFLSSQSVENLINSIFKTSFGDDTFFVAFGIFYSLNLNERLLVLYRCSENLWKKTILRTNCIDTPR